MSAETEVSNTHNAVSAGDGASEVVAVETEQSDSSVDDRDESKVSEPEDVASADLGGLLPVNAMMIRTHMGHNGFT